MRDFKLTEEVLGYVTAESRINTDPRHLTAGSKNMLIDRQRKVKIRPGYDRLGAGSTTANAIKNLFSWLTSTGQKWLIRNYDDELEVWVGTLDTVAINAWHRITNGLTTTEFVRGKPWWKDSETLDVFLYVQGDANHYQWGGGVAVASSVTATTITKAGTNTWAQARFFVNANRTIVNTRTGTEYAYTGGTGTTTLTGVTPDPTGNVNANDIFVQKVITHTNEPAASRNNDTIDVFENHVLFGSNDDSEVYMTQNDDNTDTTFSSPRVAGEGGLFTLDGPSRGFGKAGRTLVLFAGEDSIFRVLFKEITVGSTLAEILDVKKMLTGTGQGSHSADTIVQLENAVIYLSNEPALRYFQDPEDIGASPKTLSNPIKPDFDAEDFTNAHAKWFRNAVYIACPVNGRLYILEFVEDADGKLRRFWQPPQLLPVRSLGDLDDNLYAGSNAVEEVYELFADDTYSDMIANGTWGNPDDKVPIVAKAAFAYNAFGKRALLKTFDEYYTEGEIRTNTIITEELFYDFGGATQTIQRTIDGSDSEILEETLINASLGQQPLGQSPLGGVLEAPEDAAAFAIRHEIAREDFKKLQVVYSTDTVDAYWAIIAHGPNAEFSRRRDINLKK